LAYIEWIELLYKHDWCCLIRVKSGRYQCTPSSQLIFNVEVVPCLCEY